MRILMVCLGNICRSPLAEGIMKNKVEKNHLGWQVDSAGTGAYHVGEAPDYRSVAVAKENGINILAQRARQFSPKDFEDFDLIYAMDKANYQNIINLASKQEQKEKVKMIMTEVDPNEPTEVPDPYWDDNGFNKVFQMLDRACEAILSNNS